jgi:methyl-accepting chemotaxis protein
MFNLRSATDWHNANYWLGTKASPRAKKALTLLEEMKFSQQKLLAEYIVKAASVVQSLTISLVVITFISLIISVGCAVVFSGDLMQRLAVNLSRVEKTAAGNMTGKKLAVKGNDELTDLTHAIN